MKKENTKEITEEKETEEVKTEEENQVIGDATITSESASPTFTAPPNNGNVFLSTPMYTEPTKKNSSAKWVGIVVAIIFVGCLLVAAFFLGLKLKDYKEEKEQESSSDSKAELQYTDTSEVSEGVYITDVSEVVDNVMPSIVAITSKTLVSSGRYGPSWWGEDEYATGAGSGIIVSKNDTELMILTNYHVIEDAKSLSVRFINDKSVDASVKGSSTSRDIAIITVKLKDLDKDTLDKIKIATMGDSTKMKVGNGVIAIGNALGYGQSVTTGVISALNREVSVDNSTTNMIQIDAAINGGNSGGALLNSKGEVIGINSVKYSSSAYSNSASIEGMGFAIPISDVSDLITRLMNGESLTDEERGYLGVSGYMITSQTSEAYDIPEGFLIRSIVKNSGADKAGLAIGDIITEIDGKKINQFNDISEVLELKKAKEKVELKIKYVSGREYKEKTLTITLSSYKDVN